MHVREVPFLLRILRPPAASHDACLCSLQVAKGDSGAIYASARTLGSALQGAQGARRSSHLVLGGVLSERGHRQGLQLQLLG